MRSRLLGAWVLVLLAACGGSGGGDAGAPRVPGTFSPAGVLTTGANPAMVETADLNRDGLLDLAVANFSGGSVSIFLGNGNGTFSPFGAVAVGPAPVGLSLAPMDLAEPDLTVVCQGDDTLWNFSGAGNGTFAFQQSFVMAGGGTPSALAIAEFDGVPGLDVLVSVGFGGAAPTGELRIYPGNGDATVSTVASTLAIPFPGVLGGLAAGDVDRDGGTDAAVGHFLAGGFTFARGNGTGGWLSTRSVPTSSGTAGIALARLDGDAFLDYAASNVNAGTLSVRLGAGAGIPLAPLPSEMPVGALPGQVVTADFDADGRMDVAVTTGGAGDLAVHVLLGNGNGTFAPAPATLSVPGTPGGMCVGDFDRDGRPDLAVCGFNDATVRVFLSR